MPEVTTHNLERRFDPKRYRVYLSNPSILVTKEQLKQYKKEGYIILINKSQIIKRDANGKFIGYLIPRNKTKTNK